MRSPPRFSDTLPRFTATSAPRRSPLYVIQDVDQLVGPNGRPQQAKILLGERLAATSLAVGQVMSGRGFVHKLHIKSDRPGGFGIDGVTPDNPYDVFGGIGGRSALVEIVRSTRNDLEFEVGEEGEHGIVAVISETHHPTLVVPRAQLEQPNIAPALRGQEADPFFTGGQLKVKIPQTFGELVDAVRKHVSGTSYLLID